MTSDPDRLLPTPEAHNFHATMEGVPEPPPRKRTLPEDREIDYLICKQCSTPSYVFEMDGGRIVDAQCLVCGNDATGLFDLGEDAGSED
ncbi:MAG TPA: hypothetical protein VOA00_05380 [Thermoanaerobaculia bacterium]|nr:hypothetical protein [Thermoanaerobaculia bacterium]